MTVSVVIPHRDASRYLGEAVRSALAQDVAPVEVIVVDDGSAISPSSALAEFGGKVRLLERPALGVSAARNAGIAAAKGDAILFLDADDRLHEDCVSARLAMLGNGIGAVVGNARFLDERLEQPIGEGRRIATVRTTFRDIYRQNLGGACGSLYRREALDGCGFFDPQLSRAEDWDLLLRVASKYQVVYDNEPRVDVRVREGSLSTSARAVLAQSFAVLDKCKVYSQTTWLDGRIARFNLTVTAVSGVPSGTARSAFVRSMPSTWPYIALWALRFGKNRLLRTFGRAAG